MTNHLSRTESRPHRVLIAGSAEAAPPHLLTRLHGEGFQTERATDGNRAIESILQGGADLALIDLLTPGKNGLQILKEARAAATNVPIILFSTYAGVRAAVEAMKYGAEDYLLQPLQAAELLDAMRAALKKRQLRSAPSPSAEDMDEVNQGRKLETLGRLTSAIAHELNNQTTIMLGYSEILLNFTADSFPFRENLEEIRQAAVRSAGLTRQLLVFSRKQRVAPQVQDLNALIGGMSRMLELMAGEKIKFTLRLEAEPARVLADTGLLEQVIINLALNARDAMPRGGRLGFTTANVLVERKMAAGKRASEPTPHVMLAISDSGSGMDAATQARLFEPFYTTKPQGKGTGLGLSIVKQIVERSGGTIEVSSVPDSGTTFTIYLPLHAEREEPQRPHAALGQIPRGTETVLIAEDDEGVRSMLRTLLDRNGYRVLEARNSRQALEVCAHFEGPVQLLLTDVVMPDMDGPELAQRILARYPNVRVLYMSGYNDSVLVQHGVTEEEVPILRKPFTTQTLAVMLREVLSHRRAAYQPNGRG